MIARHGGRGAGAGGRDEEGKVRREFCHFDVGTKGQAIRTNTRCAIIIC